MSEKVKELNPKDVMENAHLLHRYRQELGWTIEKTAKKSHISITKIQKYVLKGQLKVSELERLARLWGIPITSFFSRDLLPPEIKQKDVMNISHVSNERGDNNFLQEPKLPYGTKGVDSLLDERANTIKMLQEQLKSARGDIEFLKNLLNKR